MTFGGDDLNIGKLKGKIREKNMTMGDFARAIGISISSLYRKMTMEAQFTREEIENASNVLELTNDELLAIFFCGLSVI